MNTDLHKPLRAAYSLRVDLTDSDTSDLLKLLVRHFEDVDEQQFNTDLAQKSHVLRVWKDEQLVGFSTLLAYRHRVDDEDLNILYSGDTIMSPECWNSPILARSWIAMVHDIKTSMPDHRCYWMLLSAGFRTYRFLPVFWREFWPRFDEAIPTSIRQLRDGIAEEFFGACFDRYAGVVRFAFPHRLHGRLAEIPESRLEDPHVAFFISQNPGWRNGDELVCLAEIHDGNLTPAGRRMIRRLK